MAKPKNPNDFYPLLAITDQSELLLIQSILEREGIIHHLQNQELQSLFGMGTIGTGYQAAIGPIRLMVSGRDFDKTEAVLREAGLWPEEVPQKEFKSGVNPATRSVLFSLIWLFGVGSFIGLYYGLLARKQKQPGALFGILLAVAGIIVALALVINSLDSGPSWY